MACAKNFDEYIEVQGLTETADGAGGFTESWATKFNIWGEVKDTSGTETNFAGRIQTETSIEVMTHYRSDMTVKDKLILDSITYNIRRLVDVDRKGKYMLIFADSGVQDG